MKIKLNLLDKKILYALDCNARISISDLSKAMRHGRDIVDYRMKRLLDEGVIVRAGAVVDPYQLGQTLFKTYLRLNNNRKRCLELLSNLKKNPKVFCLAHCDGQWDIVFNSLVRNAREFDIVQEDILNPYRDIIADSEVAIVVEQRYFTKKFLVGKGQGSLTLGLEPNNIKLNTQQTKLLIQLVKDARTSLVDLSKLLNCTTATVKRLIEEMESQKIILGYRIEVNRQILGITRFKIQIILENASKSRIAALHKYCENSPNFSNYIKQVGRYKIECAIDASSYEHFNQIIDDLRNNFCDIIQNVGTLLIREELYRWVSDEVGSITGMCSDS
jgi:DNA-binding Lrp family transcriptional regulator